MVDPITVEVVRNALVTVAEQMSSRMIKSAYSYIVREMEDCSAALFDGTGSLIAESANVPIHLHCISPCLETILKHCFSQDMLEDGDILITNDPYVAGGSMAVHHTGDIIMYCPVFYEGKLMGFTALMAHYLDVGAMWMGTRGWGVEIWQEGIRVPPLKLYKKGQLNEDLFNMLVNNTRVPDVMENDLRAQAFACRVAAEEFKAVLRKYGPDTVSKCFEALLDYSERRTRATIQEIPDGCYEHTAYVLDDGSKGGPYRLKVTVTVKGSDIWFDFAGTDPQINGPINAPLSATYSAVYYTMRCLTDPEMPSNAGCNRPIHISAPEGTLVNCKSPAACYQRMIVCHSLVDLIMGALAEAIPDKVMAESCGCIYNYCSAITPESNKRVMWGEVVAGGLGARPSKDGLSAMSCHVTNCPTPSIEATEMSSPVMYLKRELCPDSGGPGKFRGGMGQVLSYQILGLSPQFHHTSQKAKVLPQGRFGGKAGSGGKWVINEGRSDERTLEYSVGDIEFLNPGDTVTLYTAAGEGMGIRIAATR